MVVKRLNSVARAVWRFCGLSLQSAEVQGIYPIPIDFLQSPLAGTCFYASVGLDGLKITGRDSDQRNMKGHGTQSFDLISSAACMYL